MTTLPSSTDNFATFDNKAADIISMSLKRKDRNCSN